MEYYPLSLSLRFIPSLQLDVLTVLESSMAPLYQHHVIDTLIKHSSGWKELRYIGQSSMVLAYAQNSIGRCHDEVGTTQPSNWQRAMIDRDGDSQPSVVIYRSKAGCSQPSGSQMNDPSYWELYEQQVQFSDNDGLELLAVLNKDVGPRNDLHREVLVIVRRGEGVKYSREEDASSGPYIIRPEIRGKSWEQTRAAYRDPNNLPHNCARSRDKDCVYVTDSYKNVDEYSWEPFGGGDLGR